MFLSILKYALSRHETHSSLKANWRSKILTFQNPIKKMTQISYFSPPELKKRILAQLLALNLAQQSFSIKIKKTRTQKMVFWRSYASFPTIPEIADWKSCNFSKTWKRRLLAYVVRMRMKIFELCSIDRTFQGLQNAYIIYFCDH